MIINQAIPHIFFTFASVPKAPLVEANQNPQQQNLAQQLGKFLPEGEAASVAKWISEFLSGLPASERKQKAEECLKRVTAGEPVQYITGNAWFYDLKLSVSPAVLIPRPETEELVEWIVEDHGKNNFPASPEILDVGTGSGCIALALKKQIPQAFVTGVDISPAALEVAMGNAVANEMMVQFRLYDILMESPDNVYDLIVSNPPYVSKEEMATLAENVRSHEPTIALTPGDGDALSFYERLATLGTSLLKTPGYLYVELNEFHANEIDKVFQEAGYQTEMRKDLQGKWRMLKATRQA